MNICNILNNIDPPSSMFCELNRGYSYFVSFLGKTRVWNRRFCAPPIEEGHKIWIHPCIYIHNLNFFYGMYMIPLGATETIQDIVLLLMVQLLQ